ncbi:CvpA family protein [Holospora curviuscula]|uniref:Colicin V production protein n=1 Tax=Holospora curviuscula TaxID=1082868 RepID=A0A2S5R6T4_9PROT|nr:CvpA family protein [Holospora curviuscula]PPE03024.1 Colicin V production protein [Holospora curviuscula]
MNNFNIFDGLLLAVIGFSGLLGFFRGFVKETLSLLAWISAGILSWKYHEVLCPLWSRWIQSPTLLKTVCYLSVFLGTLIVFLCLIQWVALKIHTSIVRSVDALLGGVFGITRGVVIILSVYTGSLFFVAPNQQPEIIQTSQSEKWLNRGAILLESLLPEKIKNINFIQSVKLLLKNIKDASTLTDPLLSPQEINTKTPS